MYTDDMSICIAARHPNKHAVNGHTPSHGMQRHTRHTVSTSLAPFMAFADRASNAYHLFLPVVLDDTLTWLRRHARHTLYKHADLFCVLKLFLP